MPPELVFAQMSPPPHKKWKKVLAIIIIVVALLAAPLLLKLPILGRLLDGPRVEATDLALTAVDVPEAENAYSDLIALEKVQSGPERMATDIFFLDKAWDTDAATKEVAAHREVLELFAAAAHRQKFQDPVYASGEGLADAPLPQFALWRSATRESGLRALLLAHEGGAAAALDEAMNAVRLGQKMEDGQGTVVHYNVGASMKRTGFDALIRVLEVAHPRGDELRPLIAELARYGNNTDMLSGAFKVEYQNVLKRLRQEVLTDEGQPVSPSFYFLPNDTEPLFADATRDLIKEVTLACDTTPPESERWVPANEIQLYVTKNATGRIAASVFSASFATMRARRCIDEVTYESVRAILALRAYEADHGALPPTLLTLVPEYLPLVPRDPYDAKELRYVPQERIVYSVGADRADSGGSKAAVLASRVPGYSKTGDELRKMEDPTFIIP